MAVTRLRRSYPNYINVPTLLIDVVSIMGEFQIAVDLFFPDPEVFLQLHSFLKVCRWLLLCPLPRLPTP